MVMNTHTHSVCDYVLGTLTILSPFLFGFSDIEIPRNIFLLVGITHILYTLISESRYSIKAIYPYPLHAISDLIYGGILLVSPTIFGYRNLMSGAQEAVHYFLGASFFLIVLFTRPEPTVSAMESSKPEAGPSMRGGWIANGTTSPEQEKADKKEKSRKRSA